MYGNLWRGARRKELVDEDYLRTLWFQEELEAIRVENDGNRKYCDLELIANEKKQEL